MNASLWIMIGAALVSCLISSLHFALRDFSLRKLEKLAKDNGGMAKLARIVEDPESYAMSLGAVRVVLHITIVIAMLYVFGIVRHDGATGDEAGGVTWSLGRVAVAGACAAGSGYRPRHASRFSSGTTGAEKGY